MVQVPKGGVSRISQSISLGKSGAIKVGPSTASAPIRISGVIERLNLIGNLELPPENPCLIDLLPEHHLFAFTRQTGIGLEEMAPVMEGKIEYVKAINDGIFQEMWNMVRGYEVTEEFEIIEYVPIAEIHCPHVRGCKATCIHETNEQDEHFLHVKVLGFGGGSGNSRRVRIGYAIPAEGACRRVFAPVKLGVQSRITILPGRHAQLCMFLTYGKATRLGKSRKSIYVENIMLMSCNQK